MSLFDSTLNSSIGSKIKIAGKGLSSAGDFFKFQVIKHIHNNEYFIKQAALYYKVRSSGSLLPGCVYKGRLVDGTLSDVQELLSSENEIIDTAVAVKPDLGSGSSKILTAILRQFGVLEADLDEVSRSIIQTEDVYLVEYGDLLHFLDDLRQFCRRSRNFSLLRKKKRESWLTVPIEMPIGESLYSGYLAVSFSAGGVIEDLLVDGSLSGENLAFQVRWRYGGEQNRFYIFSSFRLPEVNIKKLAKKLQNFGLFFDDNIYSYSVFPILGTAGTGARFDSFVD